MERILIGTKRAEVIYFDDSVDLMQFKDSKIKIIKIFYT